jgi:hypothetical protein
MIRCHFYEHAHAYQTLQTCRFPMVTHATLIGNHREISTGVSGNRLFRALRKLPALPSLQLDEYEVGLDHVLEECLFNTSKYQDQPPPMEARKFLFEFLSSIPNRHIVVDWYKCGIGIVMVNSLDSLPKNEAYIFKIPSQR